MVELIKGEMMKDKLKYILIGIAIGFMISCSDSIMADGDSNYGEIGTVEWNPLYVKIVD